MAGQWLGDGNCDDEDGVGRGRADREVLDLPTTPSRVERTRVITIANIGV